MQKQKIEIKVPLPALVFIIMWIIFTMFITLSFGIKNKQHRDTIEIYEEYYALDEEMERLHRQWAEIYHSYGEEEYYFRYHTRDYLRYLELKKIIGEFEK